MSIDFVRGPSGSGLTREAVRRFHATPGAAIVVADPSANLTYLRRSVAEELAYGLEQRGTDRRAIARRVAKLAAQLGIEHLLERDPARLSDGETRRVAIGAAAILEPAALILDDPFSGLDESGRKALHAVLNWVTDCEVVVLEHDVHGPGATVRLPAPVGAGPELAEPTVCGRRERPRFMVGPVRIPLTRGAVTIVEGPNGVGKSTLLEGLFHAQFAPEGAGNPAPVGLVLQRAADQVVDATVAEWLGQDREDAHDPDLRHPLDLSASELRLAQVAAVLRRRPAVAALDEPGVGLDLAGRKRFHQLLADFLRGGGAAVLVSHDQAFLTELRGYASVQTVELGCA